MAKLLLILLLASPALLLSEELPKERQQALKELLHQDCGSCHGMKLTGGLGPALIGDALKGKPPEYLAITIHEGRKGTPMPPWKTLLSDADILWIVNYLVAFEEPK